MTDQNSNQDKPSAEELNKVSGVYAFSDSEQLVAENMVAEIASYQKHIERLTLALLEAAGKFSGTNRFEDTDKIYYQVGVLRGRFIVFDVRRWQLDDVGGLVPTQETVLPEPPGYQEAVERYGIPEELTTEDLDNIANELRAKEE